jgi:hypothetical protein
MEKKNSLFAFCISLFYFFSFLTLFYTLSHKLMGAKLSASRNTSIRELYQINRKRRSSMSKGTATTASSSGASSVEKSSPSIASEGTTDSTNLPYGTLKGEDDRMNAVIILQSETQYSINEYSNIESICTEMLI